MQSVSSSWISFIGIAATVAIGIANLVVTTRARAEVRYADRLHALEHVEEVLSRLGLRGTDKKAPAERAQAAHERLVTDTHVAMRRAVADYLAQINRPDPSILAAIFLLSYGALLGGVGIAQFNTVGGVDNVVQWWTNVILALVFIGLGVGLIWSGVARWRAAARARAARRVAGVELLTTVDYLKRLTGMGIAPETQDADPDF